MKKVSLFLAEGFEEIEAVATIDILRRGNIVVETISITKNTTVVGAHGIAIEADLIFEKADFGDTDMLVLPGGMPGTDNLNAFQPLKNLILKFDRDQRYLAAICAAPLIFGELGILDGKEATVYKGYEQHLLGAYYDGLAMKLDKHILTAAGPQWSFNFALSIVAILQGKQRADIVKQSMQGV
jgi:4-methyl-5(b-hydroxyethyl)-thiazole monophosphate biosynthesis